MSTADLAAPIRAAIVANGTITALLTAYQASYPVFTRRPAPPDATKPIIIVSPDIARTEEDGLDDYRPVHIRDVTVYGDNRSATTYRNVETLARAVYDLFHRRRLAITVTGWTVTLITATGPIPAPTDDDALVARMVSLRIALAQQA